MIDTIADNLRRIRRRIAAACDRVGRSPNEVTIVAVTKTHGPDVVDAVVAAGIEDIGENRIQEFLDKKRRVTRPCRWHLVGTLQRNKAGRAMGEFDLIHSVDRIKLAETLARLSTERNLITRILLEVNTSGESTKHGFTRNELPGAVNRIVELTGLRVEGLMTIGPLEGDEMATRSAFRSLAHARTLIEDRCRVRVPVLSMGMSEDFEIAIEEGATMIRLGRILIGPRGR